MQHKSNATVRTAVFTQQMRHSNQHPGGPHLAQHVDQEMAHPFGTAP
jgi:hypothetical protein